MMQKITALGVLLVVIFLFSVTGCTTLLTEKGREERDLSMTYKRVFVEDAKLKAYWNCRQAGHNKEHCQDLFGVSVSDAPERVEAQRVELPITAVPRLAAENPLPFKNY